MGIKELWSILQPFSERKPLYELEGKVVAIDLAGWVCESLCVVDYVVQPRFYLRNLFFRTCYLLLSGVTPVFVLEGDAPPLKYGVICQRNEHQFRGARPRNPLTQSEKSQKNSQNIKKPDKGRSRFNYVLKQCEELIASMGLECVQGPGEAEQFCAFLNEDKMVDGVISQDSDCFAYGARRVYRNFSVSTQGASAAQGGAVDVYDIENVQKSIDFGRNKMIVLALLCGCDYCPDGVSGVGKDAAMKLLNRYSDEEILKRVKTWRSIDNKYTSLELKVDDKSYCVNCGHLGRLQNHTKNGCSECRIHRGCDASLWKEQRLAIKSELQIRKKAMLDPEFPSQSVIDEFMNRPVDLPKLDLTWKQPSVIKFLKFMSHLLQWDEIYCFQKFLPLLTRWQLFHYGNGNMSLPLKGNVCPDYIKKKRTPKGVASYEIIWKDEHKCFEGLIPEEQMVAYLEQNSNTSEHLWSTVEPVDLVQKAYPAFVTNYLDSITTKSKKTTKTTKVIVKSDQKLTKTIRKKSNKLQELIDGNDENVQPKKLKNPKKTKEQGKSQSIEHFFKKTKNYSPIVNQNQPSQRRQVVQSPQIKTSPTPLSLTQFSFDLNNSDDDVQDLSGIIQGIVSDFPSTTTLCGMKLRYDNVNHLDVNPLKPMEHHDETTDEFDFMVTKKPLQNRDATPTTSRKTTISRSLIKRSLSRDMQNPSDSSTPILIKKFFISNSIDIQSVKKSPSPVDLSQNESFESIALKGHSDEKNVSFFFGDVTAENDVFEKLIDFRNMADEIDLDDGCDVGEFQENNDSAPLQLSETFDLGNYVPVGANLRKRIAS